MRWGSLIIPVAPPLLFVLIVVDVLLFVGIAWLMFRDAKRQRRTLRLAASFIALLALLAMALQPQWLSRSTSSEAVLITSGADWSAWQNLPDSIKTLRLIFSLDERIKWEFTHQTIPDVAYLKRHHPAIAKLHIVGHGLNEWDWEELDSIQIKPYFTPLPLGIKQAYWPRVLSLGQVLQVQGVVAGLRGEENWLYLADPGGVIDSTNVTSKEEATFQLQMLPRETGKYLYALSLKSQDGRTLCEEKLDVIVADPQPLKVLLLESKVSFETKYLKNFLSKRGGALAIRSAISRERYRFEYFNHPSIDLNKIATPLLRRFDVVIVDGQTLNDLSEMERKALHVTMEQEGLGMLIIPDGAVLKNEPQHHNFFSEFRFERFAELDERLVKPSWPDLSEVVTAIPAAPFVIQDDFGMKPLIKDEMERTLAAAYHRGHGIIGLSLIRQTYRWILEGNAPFHAVYWSYLLSELARHDERKDRWILPTTKPISVDHPLELAVVTNAAFPVGLITADRNINVASPSPRQFGEQDSIYLRQDMVEPRRWFGTFWPRQSGWHRVSLIGGESHWFYVYEKENWLTWQAAQKIAATQKQAFRYADFVPRVDEPVHARAEAIPLIWFFILFMLSCTYLWVERKF